MKSVSKKILGVILILIGIVSIVLPFTPFGFLVFVGLELLGFKILFWEKTKGWFRKKLGKSPDEKRFQDQEEG